MHILYAQIKFFGLLIHKLKFNIKIIKVMRKCYVVIGTWTDDGHKFLAGVFSSWKKAEWYTKRFSDGRTYVIKTEVLM